MNKDCVFCKIVSGDINADFVMESENFIVIKDANPRVSGHSLVIPKVHVKDFLELSNGLYGEFCEVLKEASKKLLRENEADGFNIISNNGRVAGQVVFHMHFHILPRKNGDGYVVDGF